MARTATADSVASGLEVRGIEKSYAGDPTNWWIPNRACAEAMLRSAGFEILEHPEDEVYVCGYTEAPAWAGAAYPARGERQ